MANIPYDPVITTEVVQRLQSAIAQHTLDRGGRLPLANILDGVVSIACQLIASIDDKDGRDTIVGRLAERMGESIEEMRAVGNYPRTHEIGSSH